MVVRAHGDLRCWRFITSSSLSSGKDISPEQEQRKKPQDMTWPPTTAGFSFPLFLFPRPYLFRPGCITGPSLLPVRRAASAATGEHDERLPVHLPYVRVSCHAQGRFVPIR